MFDEYSVSEGTGLHPLPVPRPKRGSAEMAELMLMMPFHQRDKKMKGVEVGAF